MKTGIPEPTSNDSVNLALDTLAKGKQALVFVNTRPSAEKVAEEVAGQVKTSSKQLEQLSAKILKSLSRPTKQCERLAGCIKKGVAFHHSGLVAKQRELIEANFRSGVIKIICNTPSLSLGVDLPAYRAIIRDLRRYGNNGLDWIPVLEYLQFAGRAGRPKFDNEGQAIIVAGSEAEKQELYERYILGEPEEIYSKLAVEPVLRTYLLSLIATGFVKTKTGILSFFEKTFWAHQFKDMHKLEMIIGKMLALLEEWEFIVSSQGDFVAADEISDKVAATALGRRVAELYLDPFTAHSIISGLQKASATGITPFSILQLISASLEMKPQLRVRAKELDDIQRTLLEHDDKLLSTEPSAFEADYEEFLNSVKTALFFGEWIEEKSEEYLLENFNIRPGEIRAKLDKADWLLYASVELARILQFRNLGQEITKLRLRVKNGAREELLPLLKFRNIGRIRARRLFRNRIRDVGDVRKADVSTLTLVLGSGKLALDMKKQVGQRVTEAKKGKRRGQLSIHKY